MTQILLTWYADLVQAEKDKMSITFKLATALRDSIHPRLDVVEDVKELVVAAICDLFAMRPGVSARLEIDTGGKNLIEDWARARNIVREVYRGGTTEGNKC